jgi:hypothetical protein
MTFRTTTNANTERVRSDPFQAHQRRQGRTRRGPQEEGVFHEALESYHEFMIGSWNDYIGVGTKITVWAPVSE